MKTFVPRVALLLFAGAACLPSSTWAQADPKPDPPSAMSPAKEALIQRLLEVTGSANLGRQMMDGMVETFRQSGVPDEFWDTFRSEIDINEMTRLIIPIYDKHLSEEDLKGLIAFYDSPLGRKVISKMPEILRESMAVGQEWGMAIGQRAVKRLEQEKAKADAPKGSDQP
jgi:hypothetical protein